MSRQTLKEIFSNDPEMLRVLEMREQTELLRILSEKKTTLDGIETIKGDKGEKGDDGYTPVKGEDYFTQEEIDQIKEYIKEDVKDEVRPVKGVDYFDGKDGKDADEGKIIKKLLKLIPTNEDILAIVPKVEPLDEEKLAKKILSQVPEAKPNIEIIVKELKKKQYLEPKDIKGMPVNMNDMRWHGGGLSKVSHDATLTGSGTPSDPLSAVGGGGTPGLPFNSIQFNNAGVFGGSGKLSYDDTTAQIALNGGAGVGSITMGGGNLVLDSAGDETIAGSNGTLALGHGSVPVAFTQDNVNYTQFDNSLLTASRTYQWPDQSGTVALVGSFGTGIEIPAGTVDGVNTVFTVTHTPVWVDVSGQVMVSQATDATNYGYTYAAGTITFANAPFQTPHSFYNL